MSFFSPASRGGKTKELLSLYDDTRERTVKVEGERAKEGIYVLRSFREPFTRHISRYLKDTASNSMTIVLNGFCLGVGVV